MIEIGRELEAVTLTFKPWNLKICRKPLFLSLPKNWSGWRESNR